MKFTAATVLFLLPLSILASPASGPAPKAVPPTTQTDVPEEVSGGDVEVRDLFRRSTQYCQIVNVNSYANCRSGPGTSYPVTHWAYKGVSYAFACYKPGDCYNGNCTWDKLVWNGGYCYVNGYLTDNNCTPARLGLC